jgi:hypothetical protein
MATEFSEKVLLMLLPSGSGADQLPSGFRFDRNMSPPFWSLYRYSSSPAALRAMLESW